MRLPESESFDNEYLFGHLNEEIKSILKQASELKVRAINESNPLGNFRMDLLNNLKSANLNGFIEAWKKKPNDRTPNLFDSAPEETRKEWIVKLWALAEKNSSGAAVDESQTQAKLETLIEEIGAYAQEFLFQNNVTIGSNEAQTLQSLNTALLDSALDYLTIYVKPKRVLGKSRADRLSRLADWLKSNGVSSISGQRMARAVRAGFEGKNTSTDEPNLIKNMKKALLKKVRTGEKLTGSDLDLGQALL